jgi:hypothetical protein
VERRGPNLSVATGAGFGEVHGGKHDLVGGLTRSGHGQGRSPPRHLGCGLRGLASGLGGPSGLLLGGLEAQPIGGLLARGAAKPGVAAAGGEIPSTTVADGRRACFQRHFVTPRGAQAYRLFWLFAPSQAKPPPRLRLSHPLVPAAQATFGTRNTPPQPQPTPADPALSPPSAILSVSPLSTGPRIAKFAAAKKKGTPRWSREAIEINNTRPPAYAEAPSGMPPPPDPCPWTPPHWTRTFTPTVSFYSLLYGKVVLVIAECLVGGHSDGNWNRNTERARS